MFGLFADYTNLFFSENCYEIAFQVANAELKSVDNWLTANKLRQRHGLAVPRAGDRSYETGSIRGWSRSHL